MFGDWTQKVGYKRYEGKWHLDLRHDEKGIEDIEVQTDRVSLVRYEGPFVNDLRHGKAILSLKINAGPDGWLPIYKGLFMFDNFGATASDPAWARFPHEGPGDDLYEGNFYFGPISRDGSRIGFGYMFDDSMEKDDPQLFECWKQEKPVEESLYTHTKPAILSSEVDYKSLLYKGNFQADMPHTDGGQSAIQHFRNLGWALQGGLERGETGVYEGQFLQGSRHGRGVWVTKDNWKYVPLAGVEQVCNFQNDMMHGIGEVHYGGKVHENVIYREDCCKMPFTISGPPSTRLAAQVKSAVLQDAPDDYRPPPSFAEGWEPTELAHKLSNPREKWQGWHQKETDIFRGIASLAQPHELDNLFPEEQIQTSFAEIMAPAPLAEAEPPADLEQGGVGLTLPLEDISNQQVMPISPTGVAAAAVTEEEAYAVLREPTDLGVGQDTAELEDVLVSGGTGNNEVLNGVYFKLTASNGETMLRHVSISWRTVSQRWAFRHQGTHWVFAQWPFSGIPSTECPGSAYSADKVAAFPSQAHGDWCVWHNWEGKVVPYDKKLEAAWFPIDKLEVKSIVGYQINITEGVLEPALLLRYDDEYYNRPVYQSGTGGKHFYLYWCKTSPEKDNTDNIKTQVDVEQPEKAPDGYELFKSRGYWIMGRKLGEPHNGEGVMAYIQDSAVTPGFITGRWQVADTLDVKYEERQWKSVEIEIKEELTQHKTFQEEEEVPHSPTGAAAA